MSNRLREPKGTFVIVLKVYTGKTKKELLDIWRIKKDPEWYD